MDVRRRRHAGPISDLSNQKSIFNQECSYLNARPFSIWSLAGKRSQ